MTSKHQKMKETRSADVEYVITDSFTVTGSAPSANNHFSFEMYTF